MYTIGSDPEVFVRENGKFVSAFGRIPGTKEEPHHVGSWRNPGQGRDYVQVDGIAAEFNTTPVHLDGKHSVEFVSGVARVFGKLKDMMPGCELVAIPVADLTQEDFDALPAESKVLGCDPDYNAYTLEPNLPPKGDRPFRTGSGHIHIGNDKQNDLADNDFFDWCALVVKELDFYLGMPSLLWDTDGRRRELYGKAGAFRPKSYGVEYRVLSNVWVGNDTLTTYIYNAARDCMVNIEKGVLFQEKYGNVAREIIDNNETDWLTRRGNILGRDLPNV